MNEHEALIHRFYDAFSRRDAETMVGCYHPRVRFEDPVFKELGPDEARSMWRMLCGRAKDLSVVWDDVHAEGDSGRAHWVASYTFSTGRAVKNDIRAAFRFEEGLIVDHRDTFDFRRWCAMALGAPGLLFGWAPPFQDTVRKKARAGLDAFMKKQAAS